MKSSILLRALPVLLLWLLFPALAAVAASFDCARAITDQELLICADPELSALDERWAALNARERARTTDVAAHDRRVEQEWAAREAQCDDADCLRRWYRQHVGALETWASARAGDESGPQVGEGPSRDASEAGLPATGGAPEGRDGETPGPPASPTPAPAAAPPPPSPADEGMAPSPELRCSPPRNAAEARLCADERVVARWQTWSELWQMALSLAPDGDSRRELVARTASGWQQRLDSCPSPNCVAPWYATEIHRLRRLLFDGSTPWAVESSGPVVATPGPGAAATPMQTAPLLASTVPPAVPSPAEHTGGFPAAGEQERAATGDGGRSTADGHREATPGTRFTPEPEGAATGTVRHGTSFRQAGEGLLPFLLAGAGLLALVGMGLGFTRRAVFYDDWGDLFHSFLGFVVLLAGALLGAMADASWIFPLAMVVSLWFFWQSLQAAWVLNEGNPWLAIPVAAGKMVLAFLYLLFLMQAHSPGGRNAAERAQSRRVGVAMVALLTAVAWHLVNGDEVRARRAEQRRGAGARQRQGDDAEATDRDRQENWRGADAGRRSGPGENRRRRAEAEPMPWWEVLQVAPDAGPEVIRNAWRRLMRQYHPDKYATMPPEFREIAERRSKEINAAYEEAQAARSA